jgi:ATP-binding cassette subfamily C protein CydD
MTSTRVTFRSSALILGGLDALASLACATLLGVAIERLAHQHYPNGLVLLLAVLGVRWLSTTVLGLWADRSSDIIRDSWRQSLPEHFTRPRGVHERGRGELALAIEQASDEPRLDALAASAFASMAGLVIVFWAGGWLCLVVTVGLLVLAVPLYRRAGRRSEAVGTEYEQRRSLLESRQLELLHHTPELRALGAVSYGANEIAAISDSEHAIALRAIRVALESSLVTEFLSGVSIGLVAMVVGFALLGGRTSLEHALIAVLITSEIFIHVRRYGSEFHRREDSERSIAALGNVASPTFPDDADGLLSATDLVTEASETPVTLHVTAGQRVLVTGASGSGKTTLLQTLIDWRAASRGTVTRSHRPVGYVSVDSSLLSGSLRDNLTLGAEIPDATVSQCLSSLGLMGPRFDDLDALLLADGRGISTGEKVRLVLARTLLARVAALLLDDIGGVLDVAARRQVRETLDGLPNLAVVEATVDTPVLATFDLRIEVGS